MRYSNPVQRDQPVKVTCIDNGKTIDAILVDRFQEKIVVELPGGIRMTMHRHQTQTNIYITNNSGMEFQCKLTT
jgi:hypothetical protein